MVLGVEIWGQREPTLGAGRWQGAGDQYVRSGVEEALGPEE